MSNTLYTQASHALRARGGRMTAQRRLILATLQELSGHPTAEQIYLAARQSDGALNPSTVYRTLGWLEEAGLISHRHLDTGLAGAHCERFDPVSPGEHHHFVCTRCGEVIEFDAPEVAAIKAGFAAAHAAQVAEASLTLYGLCGRCNSQTSPLGAADHDASE